MRRWRHEFRRQIRFWTDNRASSLHVLLYVFSDILLPFVAGMVLAYFLDPVADRLQRIGLSRVMATVLILFSFVVVLTLALVIVIPILVTQLSDFIGRLPQYLSRLQELITSIDPKWLEKTLRRQRSRAARRAELAAHRGLRLHHARSSSRSGRRAWRCSTSPACSW